MALYVDGKKVVNSLVIDGEEPVKREASLVSAQSANRDGGATLTYTFEESGTFQFITMATYNATPSGLGNFTITLNGSPITPSYSFVARTWQYPYAFAFDNITVSSGDVLTVQVSSTTNRGAQLLIFKDCLLENINLVGFVENNENYTFALNPNSRYFQVYNCKYYSGANDFMYEWATNVTQSRATPGSYWYGFTYVLTV